MVRLTSERRMRRWREIALGYTFLAPALILLLVFEIFPIFYGLYISSCDWRLRCVQFIGLGNYAEALSDPDAWHALTTTATYAIISIPVQLSLGLFLAYLLFQPLRGRGGFRTIYFLPYITSSVASAAVWGYMYSPDKGLINEALQLVGISGPRWLGEPAGMFTLIGEGLGIAVPDWAGGPSLALVCLIVFTTWVFTGYEVTIFLAGLSNIPRELFDAARVDGAAGWTLFRHITFPMISPTTYFLLIFTVIGTFKAFNHIYILTRGGPDDTTMTASIYIFNQLFQNNRYGYSAALSFLLFFVILVLTVLQNRFAGRRVVYG